MSQAALRSRSIPERQRIELAWARSEEDLLRAVRKLEQTVTRTLSPRRIVRQRLGWYLAGALLIGFAAGWRRGSDR
jgi:hypothetical protein